MRSYAIAVIAPALIIGCLIGSYGSISVTHLSLLIITTAIALFLLRQNSILVLVCAGTIALFLGILRIAGSDLRTASTLTTDFPGTVSVQGVVVSDIEQRDTYSRYTVSLQRVEGQSIERAESVLVYEPYPTRCVTGDTISFSGVLEKPKDFITETGRVFPYQQYLRQFDTYALSFAYTTTCDGIADHPAMFARIRRRLVTAMQAVLPTEEASLLGGLLLGLRGSLSKELLDAFRITGLIHIIVLSGYNVTLVAEATRRLFSRAGTTIPLIISLATIIAFVLLAGAQTAAVRAGIMAVIALVARSLNREQGGVRALLLAAAVMTIVNPHQALFNISFHLSFLATLGLLLFAKPLEERLHGVTDRLQFRSILAATIATQCTLLPYLAYAIGEVSLIGIIANVIILPLVPLAMATGTIVTVTALILPTAGFVIAPIALIPLSLMTHSTTFLAKVPYAAVTLPPTPASLTLIATASIIGFGLFLMQRSVHEKSPDS